MIIVYYWNRVDINVEDLYRTIVPNAVFILSVSHSRRVHINSFVPLLFFYFLHEFDPPRVCIVTWDQRWMWC